MSKYKALLKTIADAKPAFTRVPNLGAGRHEVILTKYSIRESQQNMGTIMSAEFFVPGIGPRGWAWFPNSQGWAGTFSQSDAKAFLEAIQVSLGTDQSLDDIADSLLGDDQPGTGVRLVAEVWQVMNKDGSPRLNQKREPIFNAKWFPIEQSLEDVAATAEKLPELMASVIAPTAAPAQTSRAAAPAQTAAPAQQAAPAQTAAAPRTGLFGRKP